MSAVVFDYSGWAARFPELAASVPSAQAQAYFNDAAALYLDNSDCSPVQDVNVRAVLLNYATAHICKLYASLNYQPASPLVGRISNATEGSVSVQAQMDLPPGSAQWWAQTAYGASFWQGSAPYRSGLYVPGCTRDMDPYGSAAFYLT